MLYNNLDLKKNIFLHAREDQKMGLGRQMAAIRVVIWKGLIFSTGPYGNPWTIRGPLDHTGPPSSPPTQK